MLYSNYGSASVRDFHPDSPEAIKINDYFFAKPNRTMLSINIIPGILYHIIQLNHTGAIKDSPVIS